MVSLYGNPACGIYNSIGEWRNLTGKAKYCTIFATDDCVRRFQRDKSSCSMRGSSEGKSGCMEQLVEKLLNGPYLCAPCERDIYYNYNYCRTIRGCSSIAMEIEGICANKSKDEN